MAGVVQAWGDRSQAHSHPNGMQPGDRGAGFWGPEGPVTSCGTKDWEESSLTLGIRHQATSVSQGVPGNASVRIRT